MGLKSPGSVTELFLHLSLALSSLNTAFHRVTFHFQVKCSSSKNHTAWDQSAFTTVWHQWHKPRGLMLYNMGMSSKASDGSVRVFGSHLVPPSEIIQTPVCHGHCTSPSAPETGSCRCLDRPVSSCHRSDSSSHGPWQAPCTPGPAWPHVLSWCDDHGSCSGAATASVAAGPAAACSRCAAFAMLAWWAALRWGHQRWGRRSPLPGTTPL